VVSQFDAKSGDNGPILFPVGRENSHPTPQNRPSIRE
jgi:hypothetical protein